MKNTFFVVAILALGVMLISFALNDPTGQQYRTVTRGQATQTNCEGECSKIQVDVIAVMGQIQQLSAKYEENTRTVKKLISKWQFQTSALINISNSTLKNLYPWNQFDDKSNLTLWYQNTVSIWKELELVQAEKKKLEIEITRLFLNLYELHAKALKCHLVCYCPPACTLQETRTRTAALECDIDIKQLEQHIMQFEGTFIKLKAEWDKYWELTQTIVVHSKTMVALYNQTAFNKLNFTGIAGTWSNINVQIKKFTAHEKRIAELVVFIGQIKDNTQKYFSAVITCVKRKCPSCTATVGEAYTTPRERVVTGTPREPAISTGGEAIGGTQLNCEQECANRGMTTQPRDWTSTIESQLNANICKQSVRISFGQIVRLSQNNQVVCTCYPASPPQLQFGPTAVCPANNPCNQQVPCNGQIECTVGNTHWTVRCTWNGWRRVMADVQKMMYQYAPQLASG